MLKEFFKKKFVLEKWSITTSFSKHFNLSIEFKGNEFKAVKGYHDN